MNEQDTLEAAIIAAIDEDPVETLSTLTAAFLGLLLNLTEANGHNPDDELRVESGLERDITIHRKPIHGVH